MPRIKFLDEKELQCSSSKSTKRVKADGYSSSFGFDFAAALQSYGGPNLGSQALYNYEMRENGLLLLVVLLQFVALLFGKVVAPQLSDVAVATVRHLSSHSEARCIDGSTPAYYYRKGIGDGIHKWLVYFEGGGWLLVSDLLRHYEIAPNKACTGRAKRGAKKKSLNGKGGSKAARQ